MPEQELKDFLRSHLSIRFDDHYKNGARRLQVVLLLDDEEISSDWQILGPITD